MPVVGLGLWKVSREETAGLVQAAIRAGYRHLDCACDYGNEAEVGQIELHPYLTQDRLVRLCREAGIAVTGFSPLGALSYLSLGMAKREESVLEQAVVCAAAQRHGKTPAQVVLRWGIQRGTAVVAKTSRPERLVENLALFDFELATDEMAAISALNCNRRFNDPGVFCEAAFHAFCPIYE